MNVIRCDRCNLIVDSVEEVADIVIEHSTHEPLRIDLCDLCRRSFWGWMRRHDKIATEGGQAVVGPTKPFAVVQREILTASREANPPVELAPDWHTRPGETGKAK